MGTKNVPISFEKHFRPIICWRGLSEIIPEKVLKWLVKFLFVNISIQKNARMLKIWLDLLLAYAKISIGTEQLASFCSF